MRRLRSTALALAALTMTSGCGSILFPAPRSTTTPTARGAELLRLATGEKDVVALWAPPQPGRSVVVFFHGNATEIGDLGWLADALTSGGAGILFVEYPGYGVAGGSPSEATLYAAGARALDELAARGIDRDHTLIVGQSLGSGVAAEMAVRGYGSRLLLISPFTSIPDVVDGLVPFGLGGVFVTDKLDTLSKAGRIGVDTVIAHGDADTIIPFQMGRDLAERIPGARLEVFAGAGHNDMFERDGGRLLALMRAMADGAAAE